MANTLEIITTYVLPGGVGQKAYQGGFLTARVTLGHIFAPDGLLAEMDGTLDVVFTGNATPVPWVDRQTRDDAAAQVKRWPGLAEDIRARLAKYIRKSAYFEGERA